MCWAFSKGGAKEQDMYVMLLPIQSFFSALIEGQVRQVDFQKYINIAPKMCTVELITTMNWMQLKNNVITTARESHVTYHTYDKNHPVSVNEEKKAPAFNKCVVC